MRIPQKLNENMSLNMENWRKLIRTVNELIAVCESNQIMRSDDYELNRTSKGTIIKFKANKQSSTTSGGSVWQ